MNILDRNDVFEIVGLITSEVEKLGYNIKNHIMICGLEMIFDQLVDMLNTENEVEYIKDDEILKYLKIDENDMPKFIKFSQPLTCWENAEKARVDNHNNLLAEIDGKFQQVSLLSIAEMEAYIAEISSDNRDWQEFTERAKEVKTAIINAANKAIGSRKQYEAEQAELIKFRQEEAERKQKEHEESIVKKAIQQEQDKQNAERKREADELASREADRKHKASIHNNILACLLAKNINENDAAIIITAIAKGEINNVKILY
jgi:hypothetical protein